MIACFSDTNDYFSCLHRSRRSSRIIQGGKNSITVQYGPKLSCISFLKRIHLSLPATVSYHSSISVFISGGQFIKNFISLATSLSYRCQFYGSPYL